MLEIKLTVIVVNYNAGEYLLRCIQSLYNYGMENMEIILIDNHSEDLSIEQTQKKFSDVKIILNSKNLGFPKANNQAFAIAHGKYIFMLNPDAEVTPGAIEQMYDFMEQHPEVALLSPRTVNQYLQPIRSVWKQPTLLSTILDMWHLSFIQKNHYYQHADFNNIFEIEAASGAALFFRREILEKIGGLDESLFWIEDDDFCRRIKNAGYKMLYFPHATIIHHVSITAKKNYKVAISNQIYSKIKFFKKYYGFFPYLIVYTNSILHVIAKIIWFSLQSPFRTTAQKKASAYWYTLKHIFKIPDQFSE